MSDIGALGSRFATLLDDDGAPPCSPADDCDVCVLFTSQRPGEAHDDWLARITGLTSIALREAS